MFVSDNVIVTQGNLNGICAFLNFFFTVIVLQHWHTVYLSLFLALFLSHKHTHTDIVLAPFSLAGSALWFGYHGEAHFLGRKRLTLLHESDGTAYSRHTHLAHRRSPTPRSSRQQGFRNVPHIHTGNISAHTDTHSHSTLCSTACSEATRWTQIDTASGRSELIGRLS